MITLDKNMILNKQQKLIADYFLNNEEFKLHLGCGKKVLAGYLNIDLTQEDLGVINDDVSTLEEIQGVLHMCKAHLFGKVTEIVAFHLFEHLPRPGSGHEAGADKCLEFWFDLLEVGGKLILELPDFEQVIKEYVAGNKKRKDNMFGLNRFMGDTHKWGYGPEDLKQLVESKGYVVTYQGPGTDYHCKFEPCQRLEAIKV